MPPRVEGRLVGVGGVSLYWQGWLPDATPRGVLLVCHGLGEHSGRYRPVVDVLTPDGWAVYGLDLRGHGRSDGRRAHVRHYPDWLADLDRFRREVVARHEGLPVFLLGHSMGGQLALAYTLEHPDTLRGLVLSAPALADRSVSAAKTAVLRRLARVAPALRIVDLDLSRISKDPAVYADYRTDPFVHHGRPTLGLLAALAGQFGTLSARARDLRLPVLLQYGTHDEVVDAAGFEAVAAACGSPDLTVHAYRGLWHEIYNEPERARPLADLREWLDRR